MKKEMNEAPAQVDARGQITLPLDGAEYVLRPDFDAIAEIERKLRPLWTLTGEASRGELSLDDMGVIAAALMRAHGRSLKADEPGAGDYQGAKPERLAHLIYEAGAPKICLRLWVVLLGAVNGGYNASGEAKPAAAKGTAAAG